MPPEGYGGIQWVVANLTDGLLALEHEVFLLGAPESRSRHPRLSVVPAAEPHELRDWLRRATVDIVHDHTNGLVSPDILCPGARFLSTHHLTGRPRLPQNCVYLSVAQREDAAASADAPVVRIPVNVSRYAVADRKDDYFLFLGRVSPHKGALDAAAFASSAGLQLLLAGPSWEPEYRAQIESAHAGHVTFLGEVGGRRRTKLLARARAVLALSQPTEGPWGGTWCEPGATVVSEAAASQTPVLATRNGCLAEIVPPVGQLVDYGEVLDPVEVKRWLSGPAAPERLRTEAHQRWGHLRIARQYDEIYRSRLDGATWR